MAMTAMVVPPVRHAIYNATAPQQAQPHIPSPVSTTPCVPAEAASINVKDMGDRLAEVTAVPATEARARIITS